MTSQYEDQCDDNNAICPYCKDEYQIEGGDFSEDDREVTCDECGMKYHMHQSYSVSTHTSPDCELNGGEHDWIPVELKNGVTHDFCGMCDTCRPYKPLEGLES